MVYVAPDCQKIHWMNDAHPYLPNHHVWWMYWYEEDGYADYAYICAVCDAEAICKPRTFKEWWRDLFRDQIERPWIAVVTTKYRLKVVRQSQPQSLPGTYI